MSRSEKGARFKRRALRRGYKVDEVDTFIARCEATLAGEQIDDPVTAADVRDIVFRTRWGGYDEWQVDLHLDRLERELVELIEGGGVSVRGSNGFPTGAIERPGRALPELPPGPSSRERTPEAEPHRQPRYQENFTDSFADLADPRGESRFPDRYADEAFNDPATTSPIRSRGFAELPPGRPNLPAEPISGVSAPLDAGSLNETTIVPLSSPSTAPHYATGSRVFGAALGQPSGAGGGGVANVSSGLLGGNTVGPQLGDTPAKQDPVVQGLDPYDGRHGKADMTVEMPAYSGNVSPFTSADKQRIPELRSSFKTRRFGSGYDPRQVDRLFDAIGAAVDGQSSAQVADADFDPSQFGLVQGGYFEDEVETALAEMRELFKRRLG